MLPTDDPSESFTVLRLRYFGNLAQNRKTFSLWGKADVRRFDVKDSTNVLST